MGKNESVSHEQGLRKIKRMAEPNNTEMIEMWQTGKLSPAIFTYFHKTRKVTVHLGAVIVLKGGRMKGGKISRQY